MSLSFMPALRDRMIFILAPFRLCIAPHPSNVADANIEGIAFSIR